MNVDYGSIYTSPLCLGLSRPMPSQAYCRGFNAFMFRISLNIVIRIPISDYHISKFAKKGQLSRSLIFIINNEYNFFLS